MKEYLINTKVPCTWQNGITLSQTYGEIVSTYLSEVHAPVVVPNVKVVKVEPLYQHIKHEDNTDRNIIQIDDGVNQDGTDEQNIISYRS